MLRAFAVSALLLAALGATGGRASGPDPATLRVVGGLDGVGQYQRHELPFWRDRVPSLTGGALRAEIVPFDRSGLRAQEMPKLVRMGVIPFGHVIAAAAASEEPLLGAFDVALANPDIATLRARVAASRPLLEEALRDRLGIELLAVYTHPAQILLCRFPIAALEQLAGRRVRTSGVGQSDLASALGARPVVLPFAGVGAALRAGDVDCAVTGALPAYETGLGAAATHVLALPVNWGVSFFAANPRAWAALPEARRAALREGLAGLERDIWAAAEEEVQTGLACLGRGPCPHGRPIGLTVRHADGAGGRGHDELLRSVVLPRWIARCGEACERVWAAADAAAPAPAPRP